MDEIYERTEIVIGKENLDILKKSHVCIVGIGGVGSYTVEALARIGIGTLTLIDNDVIEKTNINRQLIANVDNVGNSKVYETKKRINSINPSIKVNIIQDFVDESNVEKYVTKEMDYVVDAIDSVNSKIAIINECKKKNINIISCMGTANKIDPLKLKVQDISKTEVCPLAKVIRKRLKQMNINDVKVVCSTEQRERKDSDKLGSVSYVPSVAGLIIASCVVKDLTNL